MKVLKYLVFFVSILFFQVITAAGTRIFDLSEDIFQNSQETFISHQGVSRYSSYLSMSINYKPLSNLFKRLQEGEDRELRGRKEAHITVITPVEYSDVLKKRNITIFEINEIARKSRIQLSKIDVLCIGKYSIQQENGIESTFYLVVQSSDLLGIRRKIQQLYISKGGKANDFVPEKYYPHITLGFTNRDLHLGDGAIKDMNSCWGMIRWMGRFEIRKIIFQDGE